MATDTTETRTDHPHVTRRPGVCGGSPIVGGRRIPVWQIAEAVRQGRPAEAIAAEYADRLSHAAVYDAISYYYDHQDEIDHEIWSNTSDEALQARLQELGARRDARGAIHFGTADLRGGPHSPPPRPSIPGARG